LDARSWVASRRLQLGPDRWMDPPWIPRGCDGRRLVVSIVRAIDVNAPASIVWEFFSVFRYWPESGGRLKRVDSASVGGLTR
jgi:hypothetical protein